MANKRKSRSGAVMGIAVLIVLLLVLNVAASRMSATIAMGSGKDDEYTISMYDAFSEAGLYVNDEV